MSLLPRAVIWILIITGSVETLLGTEFVELRTKSGKRFRHATVINTLPSGVSISHEDGVTTVFLEDLPEPIQRKYRAQVTLLREHEDAMAHRRLTKIFKDTPIREVIRFYADIDQSEAVIASNVSGTFAFAPSPSKVSGYYLNELKAALLAEGFVITTIDDRRISITYNDSLRPQQTKRP